MSRLAGTPRAILQRLYDLEVGLGINTLRDVVEAGWSYLGYAHGAADEFTDQTGIAVNSGATYDAAGKHFSNPAAYTADLTTTGQEIHGSQHASYPAVNAFDDSGVTAASTAVGAALADAWIGQHFGAGKAVRRIVATYNAAGGTPSSVGFSACVLEYSDDGSVWTSAGAFTLALTLAAQSFDFASAGSHDYWRVRATANAATGTANGVWPDLEMREYLGFPAAILTSINFSAPTAPTMIRAVMAGQWGGGALKVSRDGGTTWTATSLDEFTSVTNFAGSNRQIVVASADVSGQPSGTSVVWQLDFGNAYSRFDGIWLQWRA